MSNDVSLVLNCDLTKFTVACDKIVSTINNDDDPNLPQMIDSNYYDINEFNSNKVDKPSSFRLLHINIASLNKPIDDLRLILSLLTHEIDAIGISEHKIQKVSDKPTANYQDIMNFYSNLLKPPMVVPLFTSKIMLIM